MRRQGWRRLLLRRSNVGAEGGGSFIEPNVMLPSASSDDFLLLKIAHHRPRSPCTSTYSGGWSKLAGQPLQSGVCGNRDYPALDATCAMALTVGYTILKLALISLTTVSASAPFRRLLRLHSLPLPLSCSSFLPTNPQPRISNHLLLRNQMVNPLQFPQ